MVFYFAEWGKAVWDSDFTEVDTLDDAAINAIDYDEIVTILDRLKVALDYWVKTETSGGNC